MRSPSERIASAAELSDALEAAARASGAMATTKDVAHFVLDLVGDEVERRREGVREATRTGASGSKSASASERGPVAATPVAIPETVAGTTIADSMSMATESRRSPRTMILAAALALIAAGVGSVIVVRASATASATSAAGTTASATATASAPPEAPSAPELPSNATTPSASAPQASSTKRPRAPPATTTATARPAPGPASPRPKFENPYGPR